MREILKSFLEGYINTETLNEEFDYEFSKNSTYEEFKREFKIFLCMHNSVFFHKTRLVTSINSNEIWIKEKDLMQIFNLYLYATGNNKKNECLIIMEFLYTYYKTIISLEYRNNVKDYKLVKNEFNKILRKFNLSTYFYNENLVNLSHFYTKLIGNAIKNDEFISSEFIDRVFNNLNRENGYDNIINMLLKNNKYIYILIKYDQEILCKKKIYVDYIEESLNSFGGYNHINDIIKYLINNNVLNYIDVKKIVNKYIDITNELVEKTKDKKYSFIQAVSEIDHLTQEINKLLSIISGKFPSVKLKLKEIIVLIMALKRFLVSDEEYSKSEMHLFEYKSGEIPSSEINKLKESLLNNVFVLYQLSKINFTKLVGDSLENYSKYPLASIGVHYRIDSKKQVYEKDLGNHIKGNNFKEYYDRVGSEYTRNHNKLRNILTENYYEELLRHTSITFGTQQSILLSILTKDEFNVIICKLKDELGYNFENEYSVIASNIFAIETNIIKLLQRKNIKVTIDGSQNLNLLFNEYNDTDHKDGLMYINYVLYESSGLNLRNNIVHGNSINSNLNIALLTSFSALIYISWLLNE